MSAGGGMDGCSGWFYLVVVVGGILAALYISGCL